MKICQTISLVQATVLFVLTAIGHMNIELLVALTAFQGFIVAFNQPARLALVPSLVPEKDLGAAVAINSVIFNTARFIGPMFAGLAIVYSGVAATFAANAVSYVAFLFALARIRIAPPSPRPAEHGSFAADLREGIRYTATHPGIAALLLLLIALGIGGRPLNELLPGFAADVYRSGAGGLSILASAIGGGAILGGVWLAHRAHTSGLARCHRERARRRAGRHPGGCDRQHVGRRPSRRGVRILHVQRRDHDPDAHSTRRRPATCAGA